MPADTIPGENEEALTSTVANVIFNAAQTLYSK